MLTSNEVEAANRAEATALLIRAGYRVHPPEADCYGDDLVVRTPSGELLPLQLRSPTARALDAAPIGAPNPVASIQMCGLTREDERRGQNMRYALIVLWLLLCAVTPAAAQVSIGIGLPSINIGINLPAFPELVVVPGSPVYYAPRLEGNFFFYDGLFWAYQGDHWYASSWYNGPWALSAPEIVPVFILRVPVRYYRHPPAYFRGWQTSAPPHWGEHWGREWEQRRGGWDKGPRGQAPRPAPLPVYQRQYSGARYPSVDRQPALVSQNYHYQPREPVVREHFQKQGVKGAPAPPAPQAQQQKPKGMPAPAQRSQEQESKGAPAPAQPQRGPAAQHPQPPQEGSEQKQKHEPRQNATQREHEKQGPQGKGGPPEQRQEPEQGRDRGQEKGQGRNK